MPDKENKNKKLCRRCATPNIKIKKQSVSLISVYGLTSFLIWYYRQYRAWLGRNNIIQKNCQERKTREDKGVLHAFQSMYDRSKLQDIMLPALGVF